jgi:hypothetical protein
MEIIAAGFDILTEYKNTVWPERRVLNVKPGAI